jgi:hypothetical protein
MIGFNTSWIATNTASFYATARPKLALFSRTNAECNGTFNVVGIDSDSSMTLASPAETYLSSDGSDPDGSIFYLIRNLSEMQGKVRVWQITPANITSQVITPTAYTDPNLGAGLAWNFMPPQNIPQGPYPPQNGFPATIVGTPDDRFSSCVVRNGYLWAEQTIGSNPNSTDASSSWAQVQYFQVGVDSKLGSTIYYRVGGNGDAAHALAGSVAVNKKGDALLDFSFVPTIGFSNFSTGYLSAAYKFVSHVDGTLEGLCEYDPYGLFCGSSSPFMQERVYETPNGNSLRTGDFSHTNIDPTDDLSFWTTAGFSNSFIGTVTVFYQQMNVYSWQSAWATLTPPQVIFEGSENIPEVENLPSCNNYPTTMQLQVTSLPNSQPGDVLIAVVTGGGGTSASASGWTQLGSPLVSNGSCGQSSTSWVFAHQYAATDPLSLCVQCRRQRTYGYLQHQFLLGGRGRRISGRLPRG